MGKRKRSDEEKQLANKVLARLEKHFIIEKRECYGTYINTKKKMRVDAIIKPRDTSKWKNEDVIFAIEFKKPKLETKGYTEMMCQAIDYTYTIFDNYGSMPVLLCPPIEKFITNAYGEGAYRLVSRILGKRQVFEIKNHPYHKLSFWHNGSHLIWSERIGVKDGARMNFVRKLGNGTTNDDKLGFKKDEEE